jgi:hypothetical protein
MSRSEADARLADLRASARETASERPSLDPVGQSTPSGFMG